MPCQVTGDPPVVLKYTWPLEGAPESPATPPLSARYLRHCQLGLKGQPQCLNRKGSCWVSLSQKSEPNTVLSVLGEGYRFPGRDFAG